MAHPAQASHSSVNARRNDSLTATGAAPEAAALVTMLFGADVPLRFQFWDGSAIESSGAVATIRFVSPDALRRIMWMPNELGLARAYVAGDLELDGDIFDAVAVLRNALQHRTGVTLRSIPRATSTARRLRALGPPLPPPAQEARLDGWLHSTLRDARAISHHYDVGNDFYRLVLGPSMTYSCARFVDETVTLDPAQSDQAQLDQAQLDQAQRAKHDLVCRKLGLHERPGSRLLDVGCGWGSMAIHAALHFDARVVGVTISQAQADFARQRVASEGLTDRVEIRVQDYRDLAGEQFDAISSIGMSEHVGHDRLDEYFQCIKSVLSPGGRLLNHAISSVGGSRMGRNSFVGRYVFPDGELIDVGDTVLAMQRVGLEVRDVESLREHYAITLRCWVANLESNWDRAVELVGLPRAKVWRLYMAGSAVGFEVGTISIHQVLGVVPTDSGDARMPRSRSVWY